MGRISYEDKMRIQTLHKQGLGAKAIRSRYPAKQWSLNTLKTICRHITITKTGSAVTHQCGSDGQNQHELRRTSLLSATWSAVKRTSQDCQVRAKVPVRLPKRLEWATDPFGASRKWMKTICRHITITKTGSAVTHQCGSGRPKSARTAQNIAAVGDMICSQVSRGPARYEQKFSSDCQNAWNERHIRLAHRENGSRVVSFSAHASAGSQRCR